MAPTIVGYAAKVSGEYAQLGLMWSLKPLLYTMQMFGIDLNSTRRRPLQRRCAVLALDIILVFLIGLPRLQMSIGGQGTSSQQSSTFASRVQDYPVTEMFGTALSATLLVTFEFRRGRLWKKLASMERYSCKQSGIYHQLRPVAVASIGVIVLLSIWQVVATSQASASHLKDGNDYLASCWNLIGNLIIQIHQELLTALFVCLSWLVAMNIQALTEDVATVEDVSSFCLIKWKRNYFAILECVREIDRFCGPAMTVMFVKVFVQTTISVFAATEVAFGNVSPPAGLWVMTVINVVSVSALMVGISRINEKVAGLVEELYKCRFADDTIEAKVDLLTFQMGQTMPRITPMGMFRISAEFYPTLIGTTITYVLFLVQWTGSK